MGDIAVGCLRAILVHIAHLMAIVATEAAAEVPTVQGVETHVEGDAATGAPVAIVVVRTTDTATCVLLVGHDIADRVGSALETTI